MSEKKLTFGQKLALNRELIAQGAAVVYDRAILLRDVYEDQEFIAQCRATDEDASELMDEECGDLCCSFHQLMAILERFPNKDAWTSGRLQHMLAVVLDERQKTDRKAAAPRPSWKQRFEELQKKHDKVVRELELASAKLEELRTLLDTRMVAAR